MKITLQRMNDAVHFQTINEDGITLDIDGSPDVGGENKGMRPTELLISGAAGCSSIDVVMILKKQRQTIGDFKVEVTAERAISAPKVFTRIHLNFILTGTIDPKKLERAIELSLEKYCSVILSLNPSIKISSSYEIL